MQLFERLCTTFLHTMPHLFPTAVSIVVKMSSPHCRMQKEGGILMRLPWELNPLKRPPRSLDQSRRPHFLHIMPPSYAFLSLTRAKPSIYAPLIVPESFLAPLQDDTPGQRFWHLSSPESAARHAWATLPHLSAAQRCRANDVRFNLTKKRRSLPKTRETSVGCPKPGSNRHVFKGHWILSPTRLPIPPFGHIHVDFSSGSIALPLP